MKIITQLSILFCLFNCSGCGSLPESGYILYQVEIPESKYSEDLFNEFSFTKADDGERNVDDIKHLEGLTDEEFAEALGDIDLGEPEVGGKGLSLTHAGVNFSDKHRIYLYIPRSGSISGIDEEVVASIVQLLADHKCVDYEVRMIDEKGAVLKKVIRVK